MGSRRTERKKRKGSVRNKILLGALALILAVIGVAGGYVFAMFNKMDKVDIDKSSLGANSSLTDKYAHIKNIALFGVDDADGSGGRSDALMVATIDTKNNKIKVTSLMRDTYVEIPGHEDHKLNSAYAFGQEELAIKTINKNFDLNIEDFVTVDFRSLPKIIEKIGGVDIEVDSSELKYINDYIYDLNDKTGTKSPMVSSTGIQNLNGVQAMAYCRIRYTTGDDFKRTERQREVLDSMLEKMLSVSVTKYPGILSETLPMVKTNISAGDILEMATNVASIGNNLQQGRFPMDGDYTAETIKGMSCLTFDEEVTKEKLHNWIFEDVASQ